MGTVELETKEIPKVHSEDVKTLISDSGITRYRVNAKIWDLYMEDRETRWHFPEGIYVEQFDSLLNVEASVEADTAFYNDKTGLWRLVGHVKIQNLKDDRFETSELFWNQKTQRVYSDSLVKIMEADGKIFSAIGFQSNQNMTDYRFYKVQPSIISYVGNDVAKPDSVQADTLNIKP